MLDPGLFEGRGKSVLVVVVVVVVVVEVVVVVVGAESPQLFSYAINVRHLTGIVSYYEQLWGVNTVIHQKVKRTPRFFSYESITSNYMV